MPTFDLSTIFSRIWLRGSTRVDFLQRMSTGDLLKMHVGECRSTVLTTPIGRIIDYLLVIAQDDALLLVGQGGARDKTLRWLRKHIFFNDDVQVTDATSTNRMLGVFADAALAGELAQQAGVTCVTAPAALGDGMLVIGDTLPDVTTDADWDAYRITHGFPAFPNELSEDYIPLEVGVWGAVSFSKGCYTGQEIIARMESRGQIAKKLCVLSVEGDVVVGGEILAENGEPVGKVTSVSGSVVLGYVRAAQAVEGASLRTANAAMRVLRAVLI